MKPKSDKSDKYIKVGLDQFETSLHLYMQHYVDQLILKGYSEDEIVAVDLEEEDVLFYMTDLKTIRIKKTPMLVSAKIAEA